MKTRVLCYGDSNTWGYAPDGSGRLPDDIRWTGVFAATLGHNYTVLEAGLNGRTTVFDDPIDNTRNGKRFLPVALHTHKPLDVVIIMLGTNDVKSRYGAAPFDIADGVSALLEIVVTSKTGRDDGAPTPLLVCPPPLNSNIANTIWDGAFIDGVAKSQALAAHYARVAADLGVAFFDAGTVAETSPLDAIHLDGTAHRALGEALAAQVVAL